jgi:hypothetical protein
MALRARETRRRTLEEFEERARREYAPAYALAMGHVAVGDLDGAFAWLTGCMKSALRG